LAMLVDIENLFESYSSEPNMVKSGQSERLLVYNSIVSMPQEI
jgi:hypothetical protein